MYAFLLPTLSCLLVGAVMLGEPTVQGATGAIPYDPSL